MTTRRSSKQDTETPDLGDAGSRPAERATQPPDWQDGEEVDVPCGHCGKFSVAKVCYNCLHARAVSLEMKLRAMTHRDPRLAVSEAVVAMQSAIAAIGDSMEAKALGGQKSGITKNYAHAVQGQLRRAIQGFGKDWSDIAESAEELARQKAALERKIEIIGIKES